MSEERIRRMAIVNAVNDLADMKDDLVNRGVQVDPRAFEDAVLRIERALYAKQFTGDDSNAAA